MKSVIPMLLSLGDRVTKAILRFPLTVLCLAGATILLCYMISHSYPQSQPAGMIIEKLMYTFVLGAFIGVTAQFICERFAVALKWRIAAYGVSILLIAGYFLILLPSPGISFDVTIRSVVAVFAMFCAFIWVPSYKGGFDFNRIALIHLKAAFISVLYSGVLSMGCAAIIATVDTLLFNINDQAYGYMMSIIWVLFATIYYLSLLPHFLSTDAEEQQFTQEASQYPAFLSVLVSYIAIPLAGVYTLVLAAYFVKILVTLHWPSGQLGGMVLAYASAGLIIYILASNLENRFAEVYRQFFPWALIPIVIMQLISVGIRLNAYGITESRYYVAGFGIFSIICAILLIRRPVKRNGIIALLAALFAIVSVVPPVDAFTVSRNSQIERLENMLEAEGMLQDGKLNARVDAPEAVKIETTNILEYLNSRDYIKYVDWLPDKFNPYSNMKSTFGFETTYPTLPAAEGQEYFYLGSDMQQTYAISGYDILYDSFSDRWATNKTEHKFTVNDQQYQLNFERVSRLELEIKVLDEAGQQLVGTGLYEFTRNLPLQTRPQKQGNIAADKMTLETENNGYKLRVMLQSVSGFLGSGTDQGIDYDFIVMFGVPQ